MKRIRLSDDSQEAGVIGSAVTHAHVMRMRM